MGIMEVEKRKVTEKMPQPWLANWRGAHLHTKYIKYFVYKSTNNIPALGSILKKLFRLYTCVCACATIVNFPLTEDLFFFLFASCSVLLRSSPFCLSLSLPHVFSASFFYSLFRELCVKSSFVILIILHSPRYFFPSLLHIISHTISYTYTENSLAAF